MISEPLTRIGLDHWSYRWSLKAGKTCIPVSSSVSLKHKQNRIRRSEQRISVEPETKIKVDTLFYKFIQFFLKAYFGPIASWDTWRARRAVVAVDAL